LRPATAKTASTLGFLHRAAASDGGLERRSAGKTLSQFNDSHFCNMCHGRETDLVQQSNK
jgi:hypothetical protein